MHVVRFSSRFIAVRLAAWALIAMGAALIAAFPESTDDTPFIRGLPDWAVRAWAVFSLVFAGRVLWRFGDVLMHRHPALAFSESDVVIRADRLLRRTSRPWTAEDAVTAHIDTRLIRLGHGDDWVNVHREALRPDDLECLLTRGPD